MVRPMKSRNAAASLALGLFCLASFSANAVDWPQYRGPRGDDSSPEKLRYKQWPAEGPKAIWHADLTDGFSSFAIKDGRAFTLVARAIEGTKAEVCVALDAASGKEIWSNPVGVAKYDGGGDSGTDDNKGGDGPRSTPSADGANVYVMSGQLRLYCFNAATGRTNWTVDLIKDHAGRNITWQNAASPLIEGDLILVAGGGPGEALLGVNKMTGDVVWKGQDDKMTHSTPTAATIEGVRQVVFFTQKGLVSVAPKTGEVLWRFAYKYATSTAISPVVGKNLVYCSNGYNVGAAVARITKDAEGFHATEAWNVNAKVLNSHWSTPVYKDGYLYGLFGFKQYGKCPLKCVEMATGKEVWSQDGFGPGGLVLIDGQLVVLGDHGQIVLVEAAPSAYKENARFQAIDGKCWNAPVVANGRIYARSTKQGVCLDISGKTASR
jgi:outer membrane protein assembly factor BamB